MSARFCFCHSAILQLSLRVRWQGSKLPQATLAGMESGFGKVHADASIKHHYKFSGCLVVRPRLWRVLSKERTDGVLFSYFLLFPK